MISADSNPRLQEFEEQGYTILKSFLPEEIVKGVRADLQEMVDEQAQRLLDGKVVSDPMVNEPFDTRLAKLYASAMDRAPMSFRGDMLHRPGLFSMFAYPPLLDLVESIVGPEIRLYPNYTVRPKFPDHKATEVLWHQDAGYTEQQKTSEGVDALRMVNVWSPFVPARVENGCMQFVPGTHRLGVVPHVEREHYLEILNEHLAPHLSKAINIELDPGDVVLFSNLLFHVGQPNKSKKIRWSVDWRYQDATQPTLRKAQGQLMRSRLHPKAVIATPQQWEKAEAGFK